MAELWVSGGRVTAAQGAALYVTNTEAYICITDSAQVQGGSGVAVKAAAGQWGSSGNNGGRLVLRSDGAMEGAIEYDSLSSVEKPVTAAGDGGKRQNAVTKVHRQDKPMPQRRGMIQP